MKITEIQIIEANEKAYDLTIGSASHTYELDNGVFVHNSLRVPKQFFGLTDDGAGFSGGESLAIISSRYAKMVKRIQATVLQAITDAVNLLLLDRGLNGYIGRFEIKMTPPTTREEIDRREAETNKVRIISDIMREIDTTVDSKKAKLEILNILLKDVVNNSDITSIIKSVIENLKEEEREPEITSEETDNRNEATGDTLLDLNDSDNDINIDSELGLQDNKQESQNESESAEMILPTPAELDIGDLSDNTTEI